MLTIYTAASFKHKHAVQLLHSLLKIKCQNSIQILDWTSHATPPEGLTPAERRAWIDAEQEGGQVFDFCAQSCINADLVIYYGQSGQDAGIELGIAYGAGVPVLGLRGPVEAEGLMLRGVVRYWADKVSDIVIIVNRMAMCEGPVGPLSCLICCSESLCNNPLRRDAASPEDEGGVA